MKTLIVLFSMFALSALAAAASDLLAINVALVPNTALTKQATAKNQELRRIFPGSYAFDKTHLPHLTLVQRFVRSSDLGKVVKAVHAATPKHLPPLLLKGLEPAEWDNGLALVSYSVENTPELKQLADQMTAAIQPFAAKGGTDAAFFTEKAEALDEKTVSYVEDFVPVASGPNFKPHISVGALPSDQTNELKAAPEELHEFPAEKVGVYQLGKFGTARKPLR